MELDYIQIGKRLKEIRGNLTQTVFGEPIGYSYAYVKNCEHGKKPSLEYLHKIVEHYGASIEWIIYGLGSIRTQAKIQTIEGVFDPELKEMTDVLKFLMENDNSDLRGWTKIQFQRAFAEYYASHEKKQHA